MLQNGDLFPSLTFARAGGGDIHLPGDLAGGFGVILIYRGSWSRACNDQLYAFSRAADKFAEEGIKVVSVSVDDRETAETLIESHKLAFPVAYAADARAVSAVTGAFVNDDAAFLEAAGFVINPDGRIATAIYTNGESSEDRIVTVSYSARAVGRLMPGDVLGLVRRLRSSARN